MNYITLLVLFLISIFKATASDEVQNSFLVHQRLSTLVGDISHFQSKSGAFYPQQCMNKQMTNICRKEKSMFITAFILDALTSSAKSSNDPLLHEINHKATQYLLKQQNQYGSLVKYYNYDNKMKKIIKFDVDDNSLIPTVLVNQGHPWPDQLFENLSGRAIKKFTVKNRDDKSKEYTGQLFGTWLDPVKFFFNEVDVVVNANALWAFGRAGKKVEDNPVLKPACELIDNITQWGDSKNEWKNLYNKRRWIWLKRDDYSTWYPSQFTFIYAVARAYAAGEQNCLKGAAHRIEDLLSRQSVFGKTRLENSQAAASYMRLLKYKMERGEDISSSLEHAFEIVKHLISNERIDLIQADKFFFYGAVGYVGTDALSIGFEIEALQNYLQIINQPVLELDEEKIKNQTDLGIEYLRDEQMSLDGSWTKMIQVSSDLYGAFMIFLYEYTGILESKIVNAKAIMSDIWTRQKKNGAFAGYPGGPDDNSINVLIYMAAKMTLENENSSRMVALEKAIKRNGGSHEVRALAYPFMALFGLHPSVKYIPRKGLKTLLSLKDSLPWIRVMAYPVLYLLAKGKIHKLNKDKYPIRIFSHGKTYYPFLKKSRKNDYVGEAEFKDWLTSNMNPDGTLFDYTPTTIPALMALSQLGEDQDELFSKGIKTLESFQVKTKTGLYQSPGEASIGETYVIINALLDMGVSADDPMIVNAEKFLLSLQQEAGGFGFSKNNTHYPDSDDTSNVIYVFKRLNDIRGQVDPRLTRRIEKGLEVLLTFQNKDGGFGTWEKDPISKITKGLNFIGITPKVVLAESIVEHTARIALNLASYTENPIYEKSYNAAIKYLLKTQLADGSYPGTWFVNYLFGTSMVVTALATAPQTPKIKRAIEKALRFILKHQRADGGFSESVKSFDAKKVVYLKQSSPAQTGLILSQLLMFLKEENGTHAKLLDPFLRKGVQFLSDTQQDDGLWHDKTWSGVTFPGLEYLYYQYVQEVEPLHVLGMYEELMRTFE